eukprot:CAMPEP_0176029090 /NCGR_PEP_ID=MMETSP0120_2-20121206/14289_1 /TAXON_ID=160619 /ORGANISM="Kryptoperidinium foliaceum, Strain CCMP 1326" /LENGTH=490 /DNA_ID=CAMNT_0017362311 /DNA_START=134 /DNA_END=1602 /DNA_ORIENTATION=+
MDRLVTGQATADDWQQLLQASQALGTHGGDHDATTASENNDDDKEDPFDCSDIRFPSRVESVERVVKEYLRRWRQLDDRKIVSKDDLPMPPSSMKERGTAETEASNKKVTFAKNEEEDDEDEGNTNSTGKKRKKFHGGWRLVEDRLRLPYNFDYATEGSEPEDDGFSGDRVLSLTSLLPLHQQSSTQSYEKELWKLFASMPSAKQIKDELQGDDGIAQLSHTISVKKQIDKIPNSATTDPYLLARMRMADRHGLPPPETTTKPTSSLLPDTLMLRFECWRQQVKKPPSPDSNRLVVELCGDQTLLDLHGALVQLAEDFLWEDAACSDSQLKHSGCFCIEDQIFTHGPVDYSKAIIDWIDGGNADHPHAARRGYLGIPSLKKFLPKPMKETRLKDIPMRLGIRYYHCCHGDVETAVFLVDRRWTAPAKNTKYPMIHDVWTPTPSNLPICDACQTLPVAYVLAEEESSGRWICEACRRRLQLPVSPLLLYTA